MRLALQFCFLFVALVAAEDYPPLATECDEELCKLPDCRCSSTDIPGGLLPRDVPQVSGLFDDRRQVSLWVA